MFAIFHSTLFVPFVCDAIQRICNLFFAVKPHNFPYFLLVAILKRTFNNPISARCPIYFFNITIPKQHPVNFPLIGRNLPFLLVLVLINIVIGLYLIKETGRHIAQRFF